MQFIFLVCEELLTWVRFEHVPAGEREACSWTLLTEYQRTKQGDGINMSCYDSVKVNTFSR